MGYAKRIRKGVSMTPKLRKLITWFKIRFSKGWKITHFELLNDECEPSVEVKRSK